MSNKSYYYSFERNIDKTVEFRVRHRNEVVAAGSINIENLKIHLRHIDTLHSRFKSTVLSEVKKAYSLASKTGDIERAKVAHINTTNDWGFGGSVYWSVTYPNGYQYTKGATYYRHLPHSTFNRHYNAEEKEISKKEFMEAIKS